MNIKKLFETAKNKGIFPSHLTIKKSSDFTVSLFKGEIDSYSTSMPSKVNFRGIFNGKMGLSSTEKVEGNIIEYLTDSVIETAKYNELENASIIYDGNDKYVKRKIYNKELEELTPQAKINLIKELNNKILEKDSRITDVQVEFENKSEENIDATSYGLTLKSKTNYYLVVASIVAKSETDVKTGYKIFADNDISKFNPDKFSTELVDEVISTLDGKNIKSGKYKVVMSPKVVSNFIDAILSHCASDSVHKHTSKFENKLNTKVLSEKLTVYEKPLSKNIFFKGYDNELVPTLNKTVIENGILKTYFYNLEEALIDNVKSTGNGTINGTKAGIDYSNITIKKGRLSEDELFNKIQNGLYITSIGGLHAGLNSSSGDFSLQAEGFVVMNGKKDHPLGLFTISGNLFDLFNNIIAIGNNLELLVNSYEVPSIAFKNVNYSAS